MIINANIKTFNEHLNRTYFHFQTRHLNLETIRSIRNLRLKSLRQHISISSLHTLPKRSYLWSSENLTFLEFCLSYKSNLIYDITQFDSITSIQFTFHINNIFNYVPYKIKSTFFDSTSLSGLLYSKIVQIFSRLILKLISNDLSYSNAFLRKRLPELESTI